MNAARTEGAGIARSGWLRAVRSAWFAVVLLVLAWLLRSHGDEITRIASGYSPWSLVAALACLLLGKVCVLLQMQLSIAAVGHRLPVHEAAYVYSSSDLSKYLPGGFWGLVGRAALYRVRGIGARDLALALFLENFWLVGGAFAIGAGLAYPALASLLRNYASLELGTIPPFALISASAAVLLIANGAVSYVMRSRFSLGGLLRIVVLQVATWLLLGSSFALLAPAGRMTDVIVPAIGSYAIAFGASLVSIFAPAGLGVREAVATAVLHDLLSVDVVVVMALANRLLSIGADLGFALAAFAWHAHLQVMRRK